MIQRETDGLVYYQFEHLARRPEIAHGVFTRRGGASGPPVDGLNLAFIEADDPANVRINIEKAAGALGLGWPVMAGQSHGDQSLVVRVGDGYRPRGPEEMIRGYDALITPDAGVPLVVKLADCQGVVLYDPESGVLGLVHSGWRGSVANVAGKAAARMIREFGARSKAMLAGIGPSLGPCCAEFVHYRTEIPPALWTYRDGVHFDFWAMTRDQLTAEGLREEHIEIMGVCTKCSDYGFFSHRARRDPGRFGMMAGRVAAS